MAVVSRLATLDEGSTYDFLTGALQEYVGSRTITSNGDGTATDSRTLVAKNTDVNILAAVSYIEVFISLCKGFSGDEHEIGSVWLEESATSETTKRSLIHSITLTPLIVSNLGPRLGKAAAFYTLVIIRDEIWEGITAYSFSNGAHLGTGGLLTLPAIDGSAPARISDISIFGVNANSGTLTTVWGGIKKTYGALADFSPIVELEKGSLYGGAALGTDGTNASPFGGANNIITYACTTSDVKIDVITMDQAFTSVNYHHWQGNYQVLLRCKLSAAQPVRIHVDTGYSGGTEFIPGPLQFISNTNYQFIEMGTISMPPFPRLKGAIYLEMFEWQLYAQRLGTATTLTADCIVLIPSDYYFKVTNAAIEAASGSYVDAFMHEDGTIDGININSSNKINLACHFMPNNFVYPWEGGKLVVAFQLSASQDISDAIDIIAAYHERYRIHGQ